MTKFTLLLSTVLFSFSTQASDELGSFKGTDQNKEVCSFTVAYQGGDSVRGVLTFSDYTLTISNLSLDSLEQTISKSFWQDLDKTIHQGESLIPFGYLSDMYVKLNLNEDWEAKGLVLDFERDGWLSSSKDTFNCN